jgi:molybdopterin-guanine dinucleotide biosynthesis protein A
VEQYADLGLPVLADQWPDQGPLAAVCTGLLHSTSEWNIFLACDLPLISGRFLQHLVKRTGASQSDAVVPRTDDGWQPLCAAYHARCRPVFMRGLQENRRSMVGFFDEVRVEAITSAEMVSAGLRGDDLANINTPEEWARIVERPKGSSESC